MGKYTKAQLFKKVGFFLHRFQKSWAFLYFTRKEKIKKYNINKSKIVPFLETVFFCFKFQK